MTPKLSKLSERGAIYVSKKSRPLRKIPRNGRLSVLPAYKKNITNFPNQRYIGNFMPLCDHIPLFLIVFDHLAMFLEHDPGENAPQMVLTLYSVYAE